MTWTRALTVSWLAVACLTSPGFAQEPESGQPAERPQDAGLDIVDSDSLVAEASDEPQRSLGAIKLPEGWQASLVAAEPLVANIVAFSVDRRGRIFVCESYRQNRGVTDNRGHDEQWLNADLAAQTVADRRAYHLRLLGEEAKEYVKYDDRIRVLTDEDGDGRMDSSRVFADGFRDLVDGTGAGVLVRGEDAYYACIPHLWLLRDADGDSRAEQRRALHSGFGVRVAFRGHDLHGLVIGPDHRLYFSIGDRGYHVETPDGVLANPESGAVFRCRLDGSELEVVATGLRNPQELAFDDFGNLFTGDNNSDSGDKARWVYVVEGGDSGWRMAYQYLPDRGPFNREKIWEPYTPDTPAYIVPPIANLGDGPSGLQYYPGVGLSDSYRGRFFLCDFRGSPQQSGVRSFRVQPDGAFFRLSDEEQTIWRVLATDLEFDADGGLLISDWVDGWNGEGKGRIYRILDPQAQADPLVQETAALLRGELWNKSPAELQQLLGHPDQRVRCEAQFELVRLGELQLLRDAALNPHANLLARVHGVWGLSQSGRERGATGAAPAVAAALLEDDHPEVRAQAARLAGDLRITAAGPRLRAMQQDGNARVRYFAAMALARIGDAEAGPDIVNMLQINNNEDPILRHGGIMALAACGTGEDLAALAQHPSMAVRQAAVAALRRRLDPVVAVFLKDGDPRVALEAARAVHDVPLPEALAALADVIESPPTDDALMRRVLNANFRLGEPLHAERLASFAASSAADGLRLEAVAMLGDWASPPSRDRVLGMWRPLPPREAAPAAEAIRRHLPGMLAGSDAVRNRTIEVAARLGVRDAAPLLLELFENEQAPDATRADSLRALAALDYGEVERLLEQALASPSTELRAAARSVWARRDAARAVPLLAAALAGEQPRERQAALADLAAIPGEASASVLADALQRIEQAPADTRLDILLAAKAHPAPELKTLVEQHDAALPQSDPAAAYRYALVGGDAEQGRRIFFERTSVSCVRCHQIQGAGGKVGPDLSHIGQDTTREYLLRSIVEPDRDIAKGFESVILADVRGRVHTGVIKYEDDQVLRIMSDDGQERTFQQDDIEQRSQGRSAMPSDLLKLLTPFEVRDLVEYLSTLK